MNCLLRKSRVYRCRRGMAVVLVIGFIVVATAILTLSIQQFVAGKRLARARWDRVQVDQWMDSALERTMALRKIQENFQGDRWSITTESLEVDRHELSVEKQERSPTDDQSGDRLVVTSQVIESATDLDSSQVRILLRLEDTGTGYTYEEPFDVAR
jgi:type II secretory pathway component PulK